VNYIDLQRAKEWIETRWGNTKAWASWEEFEPDFAPFTAGAMMETLNVMFRSGLKYAPGPSEVMKEIRRIQHLRIERGDDPKPEMDCRGRHVWAAPWPIDDSRKEVCIFCGAEGKTHSCQHHYRNNKCVWCPAQLQQVPA
jgi:hypothetical protein